MIGKLARDVSSFANADGGDIVFGIEEAKDANGKNVGTPEKIVGVAENLDAVKLRIESVLATTIDPKVQGIGFHAVGAFEQGRPVIIMRVPRSWSGPHMVTSSTPVFYTRTSAGKRPLDVHEIRSAFIGGAEAQARLRRFRDGRLGRIVANDTPVPLFDLPRVVVHVLPLREHALSPPALERDRLARL